MTTNPNEPTIFQLPEYVYWIRRIKAYGRRSAPFLSILLIGVVILVDRSAHLQATWTSLTAHTILGKDEHHVPHNASSLCLSPSPKLSYFVTMKATKKFFPYKLYRLLETIEETSTDDVAACIMWLPHGRAFIVRNEDVFVSKVLSAHFKQTRLRSFTRQLLLWGFKRYARIKNQSCISLFTSICHTAMCLLTLVHHIFT